MFVISGHVIFRMSCSVVSYVLLSCMTQLISSTAVEGDVCKPVDNSPCHCRTDSGYEVDLLPLVIGETPPVCKHVKGDYNYSFNPCTPFNETNPKDPLGKRCTNVAICQVLITTTMDIFTLASYSTGTVNFIGNPVNYTLELRFIYHDPDSNCPNKQRNSTVKLSCTDGPMIFIAYGETGPGSCIYQFELKSKYVCNQALKPAPSKLSIGSILLIVFFVGLFVYLVAGLLIQRYARGARGVEQIPNLEFWTELPGLIKDGFVFVIGCCKKDTTYEKI